MEDPQRESTVDLDVVLAPHRATVLRFIGRLSLILGAPVMLAILVHAAWYGHAVWFLAVELVCVVVLGAVLTGARPEALAGPRVFYLIGFGLVCLLALNGYGPLFGDGMMVVAWLLSAVFLTGRIIAPALITVLAVSVVGVLGTLGYTTAPWPAEDPTFLVRELLTTMVIASASAYLFHRIFAGLGESLARETEARRLELEAREARERSLAALSEAQRLEAMGRLAGGVAHDVNNALTVLVGGIELLALDHDSPRDRELLADMRGAAEGAQATARQLLAFARGPESDAGSLPTVDVREALVSLGRNLGRMLPDHIELKVSIAPELPPIGLATGELEQIVLNLCLNGRDAMPRGGRLDLRAAPSRSDAGLEGLCVEVLDEGDGMDPETRARIFEPFFTTRADAGGTGLGLSMVHGAVRAAAGSIEVADRPGGGTRFTVFLPARERAQASGVGPQDRSAKDGGDATRRTRILLVEDDAGVRRTLTRVLARTGFEVVACESVREAKAQIGGGRFHALLTDGLLTDGDASTVIEAFLASCGRAVVVYSGHLDGGPLQRLIEAEGISLLRKPVPSAVLVERLEAQIAAASLDRV